MSARSWHIVCYDIRDDRRLRRTARLLEGYGERIQYSVFRCRLTPREEERLRWELTKITVKEDAWMIIPLCAAGAQRPRQRGGQAAWPTQTPGFVIV